jgi:hypothetical protein
MFKTNKGGILLLAGFIISLISAIALLLTQEQNIQLKNENNIPGNNFIPTQDSSLYKFPTWIWYPGDFELMLHNKVSSRRTQKGQTIPQITRMDSYYQNVQFKKEFILKNPETVEIFAEGKYNIILDDRQLYGNVKKIDIPSGKHTILISVFNDISTPAIFIKGRQLFTDTSWLVSCYDKKWHRNGCWNLNAPELKPSVFCLPTVEKTPVNITKGHNSIFVDFGKETFGFLKLKKLSGTGKIRINYGESIEEANSDNCETFDNHVFSHMAAEKFINHESRAFRYISIKTTGDIIIDSISIRYEYLPVSRKGKFKCSNEKLNRIWDVSAYTLELTSREFFLDGIKRDRWVWSGDATQCYLMNYYLFFDKEINKRTIIALRGKDPVETHINTILDYSFFWFSGIYDYYIYTGDANFIKQIYPKMLTLMDFCIKRTNSSGFVEGLKDDWVFVDWAQIDKKGELSFEQILYWHSLEIMAYFSNLFGDKENSDKYIVLSNDIKMKINSVFFDKSKNCYIHSRYNDKLGNEITRYSNIFSIIYSMTDNDRKKAICQNVLLNKNILKITTPYMKFYELSALAECGQYSDVINEIENYWGGMLDLGATTFWESYNPDEKGLQHYSNGHPDRPFAKSLCHAWGAGPIYILGKYYLGVQPVEPGYRKFIIRPNLGGLDFIEGTVPLPFGKVEIFKDQNKIKIKTNCDGGTLMFSSKITPIVNQPVNFGFTDGQYTLTIIKDKEYIISYKEAE